MPLAKASSPWQMPKTGATAIVTGGTKGIGHAVVTELASTFGCRVLTCSRSSDDLDKCLQEWKSQDLDVEGIVADISTAEGREALVSKAKALFSPGNEGCLDILVNNVGTNIRKATADYTLDDLNFVLQTNFVSMFELSKLCYPMLKRKGYNARKGGSTSTSSIVNIGSVAGVSCIKTGTPYAATKAAMNQLTGNLGETSYVLLVLGRFFESRNKNSMTWA